MSEPSFKWFAAVDWGSENHQVCVLDAQGDVASEREFRHSGAGLTQLADWIQSITGPPNTVAVAIEVPHGPVVDVLLDRGFGVHSINPKQLDRLRDRFSLAGAKDDRRDARAAADGLRTDRHLFRCLQIADPHIIELREWSRLAEELQQERVRPSVPSSSGCGRSMMSCAPPRESSTSCALRSKGLLRMMSRFSGHCPGSVGSTSPRSWPKLRDLSADAIIRRCGR